MRCAISQPTFLPWLGWFDVANQADLVVLLDTVQFAKRSWQQRNRIRSTSGLQMVTVPVVSSGRFHQTINEVRVADPNFGQSFLRTVRANYARAPHFPIVFEELHNNLEEALSSGSLLALNRGLISFLAKWLGVQTRFLMASSVSAAGKRGEYLADICAALGANEYLSTAGARDYLREDKAAFVSRDVQILIHEYRHPEYPQMHKPFMSHAAALDLVMMCGPESGKILRNNPGNWVRLADNSPAL